MIKARDKKESGYLIISMACSLLVAKFLLLVTLGDSGDSSYYDLPTLLKLIIKSAPLSELSL